MNRRFIITGASGQLGSAWLRWLSAQEDVEIVSVGGSPPTAALSRNTTHRPMPGVEELASWKPYAIIHLAGPSRFEAVAEDPEKAKNEAVSLITGLSAAARLYRAKIVLLSCDRVFDSATGPFEEQTAPQPASPLGIALRAVEEAVEQGCDDRLIIRTSLLFGWTPHRSDTLLMRWTKRWDQGQAVAADGEIRGNPTWIDALPATVHALLRRDGLFHVAGPQRLSLYDVARAAARVWEQPPEQVRTSDRTPDGTPFDGGLVAERYQTMAPRLPSLETSLVEIRRHLEKLTNR